MAREVALTTEDNPFDPIDDFTNWNIWDEDNGYFTNSYLARIARISPEMTNEEVEAEVERAIDEIVKLNLTGNYKKIIKSTKSEN